MKLKMRAMVIGILLVISIISWSFSDQVLALAPPEMDSASLIENATSLDGQNVTYQGEVIGDIMQRQDHFWINVLDNGTAISIWITAEQRQKIELCGQYGIKGDQVQIVGQFFQACAEHGGDLDLHATSLKIISSGSRLPSHLNIARMIVAVGLFILACLCLIIMIRKNYSAKL